MKTLIGDCKPFLKWAGGKTQLLADIEKSLPAEIKTWKDFTYVEPFAGSGAVLFWILRTYPNLKKAVINDINGDLINVYSVIKETPEKLISALQKIQNEYYALSSEEEREAFFYTKRELYNTKPKNKVLNSCLFIFLNRTCFNGLYRVNSKGGFNVPFGRYSNPTICDEQTILADSRALQKVEILNDDFEKTAKFATGRETLFYFDPPYKPLSTSSNFNAYDKNVFNDREQERLKKFCDFVNEKDCLLLLSNSDVNTIETKDKFFDSLYSNYCIERVFARRSINADAKKRGTLKELLITNYSPQKTTKSIRA